MTDYYGINSFYNLFLSPLFHKIPFFLFSPLKALFTKRISIVQTNLPYLLFCLCLRYLFLVSTLKYRLNSPRNSYILNVSQLYQHKVKWFKPGTKVSCSVNNGGKLPFCRKAPIIWHYSRQNWNDIMYLQQHWKSTSIIVTICFPFGAGFPPRFPDKIGYTVHKLFSFNSSFFSTQSPLIVELLDKNYTYSSSSCQ